MRRNKRCCASIRWMPMLALAAAAATPPAAAAPEGGADPAPAASYEARVRPPRGAAEKAIASERVSFDPALDCVAAALARRAPEPPDPRRYRHALSIACGSPLYVVEATVVPAGKLRLALERVARVLLGSDPVVLGTARMPGRSTSVMVVAARRTVELAPFPRDGGGVLRGRLLLRGDRLRIYQATARGVRAIDVPIQPDGRFEVTPQQRADGVPDADLELELYTGRTHGPAGRIRIGAGAPAGQAAGAPATLEAAVAAWRGALGQNPVVWAANPGGCDAIPAKVGAGAGIDITDRATCVEVPLLDMASLADEVAHRAALRAPMVDPRVAVIEVATASVSGPPPAPGVAWRVLRRFEELPPDRGRARVLELLRRRWPSLTERRTPAGALDAIVAKLRAGTPDNKGSEAVKPEVDRVARRWTTTRFYYSGALLGRDLDWIIEQITPDAVPRAADAALVQGRSADGMMRHFVAIVLELP